jgi:hypothetical protein
MANKVTVNLKELSDVRGILLTPTESNGLFK